MHAATYCGHPVCCAVGLRNVEIIEARAVERAAVMGKSLLAGLDGTARSAECRRCPRSRHDVRRRAGRRPGDQGAGARARRQGSARGDGARPLARSRAGSADPADRRHDLPVAAADDPGGDARQHPPDSPRVDHRGDANNPAARHRGPGGSRDPLLRRTMFYVYMLASRAHGTLYIRDCGRCL